MSVGRVEVWSKKIEPDETWSGNSLNHETTRNCTKYNSCYFVWFRGYSFCETLLILASGGARRTGSFTTHYSNSREDEREDSDGNRGDESATVDETRLAAQLRDQVFIFDRLFARVEVARPARGERDAGSLARL